MGGRARRILARARRGEGRLSRLWGLHLRPARRIRAALDEYLETVISEEAQPGVERIDVSSAAHAAVGTRLRLEVARALNEVALDGVGDALDRTTIDSVHEEIRAVLCARSTRITLTNQRMPKLHWVVLLLMSFMTILGVALINISIAPGTSAFLTSIVAFVIPLSFSVVVDMATPFDGVWTADVSPLCGVRAHALSQLDAAAVAAGGSEPKAKAASDVVSAPEVGPLAA